MFYIKNVHYHMNVKLCEFTLEAEHVAKYSLGVSSLHITIRINLL